MTVLKPFNLCAKWTLTVVMEGETSTASVSGDNKAAAKKVIFIIDSSADYLHVGWFVCK